MWTCGHLACDDEIRLDEVPTAMTVFKVTLFASKPSIIDLVG